MEDKKRKIVGFMLAFIMIFSAVLPNILEVHAASFTVKEDFKGWTWFIGSSKWGNGGVLSINGETAFCLEPDKAAFHGTNTTILPSTIGISDSEMADLCLIAYYGWRSQPSVENYFLTQNLIWSYLDSSQRVAWDKYPTNASMQPFFNSVMAKVNRHNIMPSFDGKSYEINFGDSLTISDTNGVLSDLIIGGVTGGSASISGNNLVITPDGSSENMKIILKHNLPTSQTQTNFVVRNGNSQAVSRLTGLDPYRASVNIKVNLMGNIELTKTDVNGNLVDGAKFKATHKNLGIEKIATVTDGKLLMTEMRLGKWTLKEIEAPPGYVLDPTEYEVEVGVNQTTPIEIKNKKVEIEKSTLDGDKVIGAKMLIKDENGNIVDSWTTTEKNHAAQGIIEGKNYVLVEDEAPEGYVKAKDVPFYVTPEKRDQTIKMLDKQVEFRKVDNDGNLLSKMEYVVTHNKTKQIVDRGVTNAKDKVFLNNLVEGERYTISEINTPEGFVTAKPVEFTVSQDKELQTVIMIDKKAIFIKENPFGLNLDGGEYEVWLKSDLYPDISNETDEIEEIGSDIPLTQLKPPIKPVFTFTGDKDGVVLENVKEGETYILREIKAPSGYEIGEDIEFTITEDKETQVIKMTDRYIIGKIDISDKFKLDGIKEFVETNDPFNIGIIICILVAVSIIGVILFTTRKK